LFGKRKKREGSVRKSFLRKKRPDGGWGRRDRILFVRGKSGSTRFKIVKKKKKLKKKRKDTREKGRSKIVEPL